MTDLKRDGGPQNLSLVIMAAGQSRRYSIRSGKLKQLEGFGPHEEPILFYTIYDALLIRKLAGIRRVVLVISEENRDQFEQKVVKPWKGKVEITLVAQRLEDLPVIPFNGPGPAARSRPWGTGHAVWAARNAVDGPFLLANADDFYGRGGIAQVASHLIQMMPADLHDQWALQAYDLMETLPADDPDTGYNRGFCLRDENDFLQDITETLDVRRNAVDDPHQWVSMNLWGLQPGVFELLEEQFQEYLANEGHNPDKEFYLPHALAQGIKQGQARIKVLPPVGRWLGVTHPADAERIRHELNKLHENNAYPEDLTA